MKKFIAILIIFCGFQIDSSSHQGEEDHHSQSSSYLVMDQDIERYTDFWGDKNSQRFLRVMLDVGYGHAMQRPQEDWEDMDWAWEQKEKAFPLLLEILRREPNENKTAPELEWTNISRKGYAIEYVLSHPEGDLKPFVKEARKQLPYWLERKVTSGMNSIFIGEALELLSTKGDASDIPLIEGFLEDPNRNNRSYARKNLAVLKERLAKEFDQNRKDRVITLPQNIPL